jgi:hypothetical protein
MSFDASNNCHRWKSKQHQIKHEVLQQMKLEEAISDKHSWFSICSFNHCISFLEPFYHYFLQFRRSHHLLFINQVLIYIFKFIEELLLLLKIFNQSIHVNFNIVCLFYYFLKLVLVYSFFL